MTVPVFSRSHLRKELEKLKQFSSVLRSLLFLNCGGSIDLTEQWFYEVEGCTSYLIDYHRPFHHNNLIDLSQKIFVFDDGCNSFRECPSEEDVRVFYEL